AARADSAAPDAHRPAARAQARGAAHRGPASRAEGGGRSARISDRQEALSRAGVGPAGRRGRARSRGLHRGRPAARHHPRDGCQGPRSSALPQGDGRHGPAGANSAAQARWLSLDHLRDRPGQRHPRRHRAGNHGDAGGHPGHGPRRARHPEPRRPEDPAPARDDGDGGGRGRSRLADRTPDARHRRMGPHGPTARRTAHQGVPGRDRGALTAMNPRRRTRAIIPEVVQISATDCGPASIKSVCAGMGLERNYRVLREACQTDVDGTSIDTLEELSIQLGLDAEQIMLPMDHVFLPEARALPAIVVTLSAGGRQHFIVLWKRFGPFVQVMDPLAGRRWTRIETLAGSLYQHTTSAPAAACREWAGSEEAVAALERRLLDLGAASAAALIAKALEDPRHHSIAALDAATRAVEAVVRAGALRRGRTAAGLVQSMIAKAESGEVPIPERYWSVRPNPDAEDEVLLTGAVL